MALSKWDDYLIHQIAEPIDTLATDSPHFMDRLWFMAYSEDGSLQMMAGLGSYPNTSIMDGFLLVRHQGIQRNFRASRHIAGDRAKMEIGPLSFVILEPQERWRINLGKNDFGIECALEFQARMAPFLFPRLGFKEQEQLHYKQPGHCSGSITFEGKKFAVDGIPGVRDRSWGVRKPGMVAGIGELVVVEAHFSDSAATMICLDSAAHGFHMRQGAMLGDDGNIRQIVEMKHRIVFESGSQRYKTIDLLLTDSAGREQHLVAKAISAPCYFTGGGYDGRHGMDRGPLHLEGERWDVNKDATSATAVFPYYSRVAELTLDGHPGIGHVEALFSQDKDWLYQPTWKKA